MGVTWGSTLPRPLLRVAAPLGLLLLLVLALTLLASLSVAQRTTRLGSPTFRAVDVDRGDLRSLDAAALSSLASSSPSSSSYRSVSLPSSSGTYAADCFTGSEEWDAATCPAQIAQEQTLLLRRAVTVLVLGMSLLVLLSAARLIQGL